MFPENFGASTAGSSTEAEHFYPGSVYSNASTDATIPTNYRRTPSLSSPRPLLWQRRLSHPALRQTPLMLISSQVIGSVPRISSNYDPIMNMYIMLQQTAGDEDSSSSDTPCSPAAYAEKWSSVTTDQFNSFGGEQQSLFADPWNGSIQNTELDLFDRAFQEPGRRPLWTMNCAIRWETNPATLYTDLCCEGIPRRTIMMTMDLVQCWSSEPFYRWKAELVTRLQVARISINVDPATGMRLKEEDCERFGHSIISEMKEIVIRYIAGQKKTACSAHDGLSFLCC